MDGNITGPEPYSGKQYYGKRCTGNLKFSSEPLEIFWDPSITPSVKVDPICNTAGTA